MGEPHWLPGKWHCPREEVPAYLSAWEKTKLWADWELFPCWEGLSWVGEAIRGDCADFLGSHAVLERGHLPACEVLKVVNCEEDPVIFPSFLAKLLNLFTCLFLTLLNLILPTFSMRPWHCLNMGVDKIDANFDLHNSVCLALLSSILLTDLILACRRCFSCWFNYFPSFFSL